MPPDFDAVVIKLDILLEDSKVICKDAGYAALIKYKQLDTYRQMPYF